MARKPRIQVGLRLPDDLHKALASDALDRDLSLNATIVLRLHQSFIMDGVKDWLDAQKKGEK